MGDGRVTTGIEEARAGSLDKAAAHDGAGEMFEWIVSAGKRVRVLARDCEPMPAEQTTFEDLLRSGEVVASPRSAAWASAPLMAIEDVKEEPRTMPLQFPRNGPEPPCTQMTLLGTPAPCARPSPTSPVSIWAPSERKGGDAEEDVLEAGAMHALGEILEDIDTPTARGDRLGGEGGY
jgi:hypothetical protein